MADRKVNIILIVPLDNIKTTNRKNGSFAVVLGLLSHPFENLAASIE